jgi:hypothetical protein
LDGVFLSHNHRDKPFIRMLAYDIAAANVDIWLDELVLDVGDSLLDRISTGIYSSTHVVVGISNNSLHSRWVAQELELALSQEQQTRKVLPILLGDLRDEDLPAHLANRLCADFRLAQLYDESFILLLRSLDPQLVGQSRAVASLTRRPSIPVNVERHYRLVELGQSEPMRSWVVKYLSLILPSRADPTERYWIYLTLGRIGGTVAEQLLAQAEAESDPFARSGVERAASLLASQRFVDASSNKGDVQ